MEEVEVLIGIFTLVFPGEIFLRIPRPLRCIRKSGVVRTPSQEQDQIGRGKFWGLEKADITPVFEKSKKEGGAGLVSFALMPEKVVEQIILEIIFKWMKDEKDWR